MDHSFVDKIPSSSSDKYRSSCRSCASCSTRSTAPWRGPRANRSPLASPTPYCASRASLLASIPQTYVVRAQARRVSGPPPHATRTLAARAPSATETRSNIVRCTSRHPRAPARYYSTPTEFAPGRLARWLPPGVVPPLDEHISARRVRAVRTHCSARLAQLQRP